MHEDAQGALWIGTMEGLYRWKEGSLKRLTRTEGLFDNRIFQILPDGRGNLWMSCNKGIFRVSQEDLEAVADGRLKRVDSRLRRGGRDALRGVQRDDFARGHAHPRWPAVVPHHPGRRRLRGEAGRAAHGPASGAHRAAPRGWKRHSPVPMGQHPPGGGERGDPLHVPGAARPAALHFRYQLEGVDVGPVEAGPRRVAYYTHLSPGHYRFQVTAQATAGGQASPVAELRFYLKPRFHQTLLFRVVCVLAAVLAMAGAVWLRLRRLRLRAQELQARVSERTAELATVNAHLSARLEELQATRERLVHAEKMAAVGTLAAGVGHEINNPLAFIIANLNFVTEEVRDAARDEGTGQRWGGGGAGARRGAAGRGSRAPHRPGSEDLVAVDLRAPQAGGLTRCWTPRCPSRTPRSAPAPGW